MQRREHEMTKYLEGPLIVARGNEPEDSDPPGRPLAIPIMAVQDCAKCRCWVSIDADQGWCRATRFDGKKISTELCDREG